MAAMQARITCGDTLALSRELGSYSAAAGWVLHYRLVPRDGGTAYTFAGTASGSTHVIDVAPATTAGWVPGTYSWAAWVTDGTDSHTIDAGTVVLVPNPRTAAGPLDLRSDAQTALDNVRSALRGKASADVLRYTIAGRSLERYSVGELIKLESSLATQVKREQRAQAIAQGLPDPSRYQVRIGRA